MKLWPAVGMVPAIWGVCAFGDGIEFSGDRWRVQLPRDAGTMNVLVQPADQTGYVSLLRPGGERPWYGYNLPAGREVRTSDCKPALRRLERGGGAIVRSVLEKDQGVVHEAIYVPIPEGLIVISRFSAKATAPRVSILRFAPKLDVDTDQLTHYAYQDGDDRRHEGAVAKLGERNTYAGVGAWEPGGDVAESLSAARPYMLLYNPQKAISLGVILPLRDLMWHDARTFLQLYRGGWNFWYTGFFGASQPRGERVFILYLRQCSSADDIEQDAPRLCREIQENLAEAKLPAPEAQRVLMAARAFEGESSALEALVTSQPPTREAWLAIQMLRAARQCASHDPTKALGLVQRGKAVLGAP